MQPFRWLTMGFALIPACLVAQERAGARTSGSSSGALGPSTASATTAVASRASKVPIIDGKGDDPVWATAQVIDAFRTFDPVDNGDPRYRTEARVAFDEK